MNSLLNLFHMAASNCGTKTGVLPSLYDGLGCGADGASPSIKGLSDISIIIANVIRIIISISGSLAIIIILVAAVFYVTSAGDPGRVKRAKDILVNTVVGLVIILAAYAIVTFIAGEF
ncbi:MAG: hypothetical protein NVSMB39_1620 [Candidatus Saccharimonadales bacterium]